MVSTKVGRRLRPHCATHAPDDGLAFETFYDYSYDGAMRSLDDSLQRLGLCHVDIALIHDVNPRWHGDDYERRFREAMEGAYPRARAPAQRRRRARHRRGREGLPTSACASPRRADFDCFMLAGGYTLLEHAALDEFLPYCAASGIAVLVASPFNSGILATGAVEGARYFYQAAPDDVKARVRRIDAICRAHDVPLGAVALQFCLAHPAVTTAVCGYRTHDEVDTNLRWSTLPIPDALWQALKSEQLLPVDAPVPGVAEAA